ncbi:hypothetical protein CDAR_619761 [Caerostris darwini]|uniref:Uncharacterized protein n=1 Tax=Caerostris darwini TaxID=1538125 RepID=A0AAV4SH72_9ARAC|nr:hypothetical protein CDAR_619761 [Caerostris darwini]
MFSWLLTFTKSVTFNRKLSLYTLPTVFITNPTNSHFTKYLISGVTSTSSNNASCSKPCVSCAGRTMGIGGEILLSAFQYYSLLLTRGMCTSLNTRRMGEDPGE